jgi:hypothetical protein
VKRRHPREDRWTRCFDEGEPTVSRTIARHGTIEKRERRIARMRMLSEP